MAVSADTARHPTGTWREWTAYERAAARAARATYLVRYTGALWRIDRCGALGAERGAAGGTGGSSDTDPRWCRSGPDEVGAVSIAGKAAPRAATYRG
ncbi:hypothetical protein KRMM14A1004_18800 [Krasilnikovia sp. MM14-A1004]